MNAILEIVSQFLEQKDLQFAANSDGETLLLPCSGERLQWNTTINVSEQGNCLSFIARLPAKIPESHRQAAAELIARINFGRRLGAFHLDSSDGEVLYCISQMMDDQPVSTEVLEMLLGISYVSMDNSGPDIMKLALGIAEAPATDSANEIRLRTWN